MEKRYDVLEFYKIVNELIDLSRLENTKEKFLDIDIIKEKSTLDKELMLMGEMIDFYKYDDGFELAGLSDIQRFMRNVEVIGSYLSSEDLANLKRNLTIFRISKSRAKMCGINIRIFGNYLQILRKLRILSNLLMMRLEKMGH